MGRLLKSLVLLCLFITITTTNGLSSSTNGYGNDVNDTPLENLHPKDKFGFFDFGFPIDEEKSSTENINNGGFSNETERLGSWEIHSKNAGVSAMHIQLMPNNKVVWHDSTSNGLSEIENDPPFCRPRVGGRKTDPKEDCTAHAIVYDIETAEVMPLKVQISTFLVSANY